MVKNPSASTGDTGSIPGSGRSPGEGNGNPLQYSCLGDSMDGGAWWPTNRVAKEQDTTEHAHTLESTAVNEHDNFTAALPAQGETAAEQPGSG